MLQQYFASTLPLPTRIRYEITYMSAEMQRNVSDYLQRHGMSISYHGRMDVEWSSSTASPLPEIEQHTRRSKRGGGAKRGGGKSGGAATRS